MMTAGSYMFVCVVLSDMHGSVAEEGERGERVLWFVVRGRTPSISAEGAVHRGKPVASPIGAVVSPARSAAPKARELRAPGLPGSGLPGSGLPRCRAAVNDSKS